MQQKIDNYIIGSKKELSGEQLNQLQKTVETPAGEANGTLGGRAAVSHLRLAEVGPVVVKHYTRGGLIRSINYNTYLKTRNYRCKEEFDILSTLYEGGVNVPEPIAYIIKGKVLYNAWIVTKEVEQAKTLVDFSTAEPEKTMNIIKQLQEQIQLLISFKIHHVDLHPGNVLIDGNERVFIIDFDKASPFSGSTDQLYQNYISRWQRAITKHQLSDKISLKA